MYTYYTHIDCKYTFVQTNLKKKLFLTIAAMRNIFSPFNNIFKKLENVLFSINLFCIFFPRFNDSILNVFSTV